MNAAEHEDAAFLQSFQRGRNELAGGRKNNGGIEFFRRLIRCFARPHRAELQRKLLMLRAARGRVNFRAPVARHLNRDVRGRAETVKSEPPAALDSGKAQTPKADDPGAQQRRGLFIGKRFGNRINERLGCDRVFGVAAVDRVAGERRMIAEIFPAGAAEFAGEVRAVKPRHADARAPRETMRALAQFFDDADDLVAGNHRRFARRQFAFHHVEIGAADAAAAHAQKDFALAGLRDGRVREFERIGRDRRGRMQEARFHRVITDRSSLWLTGRPSFAPAA